jgi:hypothetical protein
MGDTGEYPHIPLLAGCNSAILKQFVEINRNMKDECWHPECYIINQVRFDLQKILPSADPSYPRA